MVVYVLLFNARTENEGIHTLKIEDRNVVLMFENEDDATRFGLLLEAQDFPTSTVESFDPEEIEEFCQSAGYECKRVPEGALAMPPETNLEQTDWDPNGTPEPGAAREDEADPEFSETELDRIRRQFENLL